MDTGMKLNEWLTLAAIVLGPISAVVITLWIEKARRVGERRMQIMRTLLATRHMPADAQYNVAINLIPAEFNDQEKVMSAWRKYQDKVSNHPALGHEEEHERLMSVAQSGMIFEIMQCVGLKHLSEGDVQTQAYVSQGFVNRDMVYIESLRAMPKIAATLEEQRKLTQIIVDNIPRPPPPPPTITSN